MSITGVIFLIGYASGCLLALSRHPIFGLMTYVAVFYLHPPSRWWGQSLPNPGWALLAACITLLAVMVRKNTPPLGPLLRERIVIGLMVFLAWACIQSFWALNQPMHREFIALFFKYILLIMLIHSCVDSERHLLYFLWTHVLGCFYLGWLAFMSYGGGRFEGFGGPGIGDANTGGFQIVTGMLTAGALLLAGRIRERIALIALLPVIVNGLVTTISRSGFLSALVGGLIFNFFAPKSVRQIVRILSVLGVFLFFLLTNDVYWGRIESLKQAGEQVEGVDTGTSRLVIMNAQWHMFQAHPLGCGHRCTATLSPDYMADQYLTGPPGNRSRSSHNTFMTLLVEQGIPGAIMYFMMVLWAVANVLSVSRACKRVEGSIPMIFPAVAAIVLVTIVGDLFVDYLKLEVRIWFIALLLVIARMARSELPAAPKRDNTARSRKKPVALRRPRPRNRIAGSNAEAGADHRRLDSFQVPDPLTQLIF